MKIILILSPGANTLDLWKVRDVPPRCRLCYQFCNLTLQGPGLNSSNNKHNYKTRHLGLGWERENGSQEVRVRIVEQLLVIEQ